jgi:hypothetical protein
LSAPQTWSKMNHNAVVRCQLGLNLSNTCNAKQYAPV